MTNVTRFNHVILRVCTLVADWLDMGTLKSTFIHIEGLTAQPTILMGFDFFTDDGVLLTRFAFPTARFCTAIVIAR